MANWNKVTLIGNLTRDIEMRVTQGGMQVAKFGRAINRKSKDTETTGFVDCTAFGKSAELLAQYVGKGSPLFVDGRLEFSTWEAKDGAKRSKLEVVVENFQFLSNRSDEPESHGERRGGGRQEPAGAKEGEDYGDIPF